MSSLFNEYHYQILREAANQIANFISLPRNKIVLKKEQIIQHAQKKICKRQREGTYPFKIEQGYYCHFCQRRHPKDITLKRRLEEMASQQDFFVFNMPKGEGLYRFAEAKR